VDTAALQRLVDRQEITDLLHTYARAVDRLDGALLRTVYTPEGTDDHGAFAGTADDYVTWVMGFVGGWVSTHHDISNVMIELDGDERAFGECHWTGWYVIPDGAGGLVDQVSCGRYLDRFEKVDGRWGIAHRVCVSDWSRRAAREGAPRDHRLAGRRGTDDLVYSLRSLRLPG
jgi:hypothetical protein